MHSDDDSTHCRRKRLRNYSQRFKLSTGDRCVQICKTMFLRTLGISDDSMNRVLSGQRENGGVFQPDRRERHDHKAQILSSETRSPAVAEGPRERAVG